MTIEVGKSVQKLTALIISGIGGLYLISLGHYEAGGIILASVVAFAVGDYNGSKKPSVPEELYKPFKGV